MNKPCFLITCENADGDMIREGNAYVYTAQQAALVATGSGDGIPDETARLVIERVDR